MTILILNMFTQLMLFILLIGPYLASLNLDKLILDSEKENKPEDKISKFGMDSTERLGADGGNRNAGIRSVYNYYFLFLCYVLSLA